MNLYEDDVGNHRVLLPEPELSDSNKTDIIADLSRFPHVLEQIFSHLPGTDLRVIPCISKKWNKVINTLTPKANKRRKQNLKRLRSLRHSVGRENWPVDVECSMFKKKRRKQKTSNPVIFSPLDNSLPKHTRSRVSRSILGNQNVNTMQSGQQSSSSEQPNTKRRLQVIDDNFQAVDSYKRSRWRLAMSANKRW